LKLIQRKKIENIEMELLNNTDDEKIYKSNSKQKNFQIDDPRFKINEDFLDDDNKNTSAKSEEIFPKNKTVVSSWLDLMGDSGESDDENVEELVKTLEEEKNLGTFQFFPDRKSEPEDKKIEETKEIYTENENNEESDDKILNNKNLDLMTFEENKLLSLSDCIFPFLHSNWNQSNSIQNDNLEEYPTVDYSIQKEGNTERPSSPSSYFMRLDSLDQVNKEWKDERLGLTKLYKNRNKTAIKRRKKFQLVT